MIFFIIFCDDMISYLKSDFEIAKQLYCESIVSLEEHNGQFTEFAGDVQVKMSNILQGTGDLSGSIEHLRKAELIYRKCIEKSGSTDNHVVSQKLIEVITGIANNFVDQREIEMASDSYKVCDLYKLLFSIIKKMSYDI